MIGTEKSADLIKLVDIGKEKLIYIAEGVNKQLSTYEPLTLVFGTVLCIIGFKILKAIFRNVYNYLKNFKKNIVITLFNLVLTLPWARRKFEEQENKLKEEFKNTIK